MSNFRRFAIVGAGKVGNFIIEELLRQKAAGAIDDVTIISRVVRPIAHSCTHTSLLPTYPLFRPPPRERYITNCILNAGLARQGTTQILRRARRPHRVRRVHRCAGSHDRARRRARRHLHDQPHGHRRAGAHRTGCQGRRREPLPAQRVRRANGELARSAWCQGRATRQTARGRPPAVTRL